MKTFGQFLTGALILAILAVIVSKNATVAGWLTTAFNSLSSWINQAMGPPQQQASNDSSSQSAQILQFPSLMGLLASNSSTGTPSTSSSPTAPATTGN